MCGFVPPTEGDVFVWNKHVGRDVDFPDSLGFVIESPGFLPMDSGLKNLKYLASIKQGIGADRIWECMELVGLDPNSRKPVGKYSLGMRQRLGIAQAIMENPEILILDEPMNGLDNHGVEDIRSLLLGLKKEGKTIIIASHSAEDIDILCDAVYEMDAGMIRLVR
ncbi:ATP-binding cassette domain-containing protein [Caproiciproducens galactitolivorans]